MPMYNRPFCLSHMMQGVLNARMKKQMSCKARETKMSLLQQMTHLTFTSVVMQISTRIYFFF